MLRPPVVSESVIDGLPRKIVHVDMDCFYAAVELRDRPDLKDKPVAVGGHPDSRGIITTCNYVARDFGVHSALSTREAIRRCPKLIILPTRFATYKKISRQIHKIYREYTPLIEPISLDEAYLDLTENTRFEGRASRTAARIRQDIFEQLGLTASAGIAPNKFLAKIASDWKKPNGQFTVQPHEISAFIKALPVKKIPGVGKATQAKMTQLQIETCSDLQTLSLSDLNFYFGRFGERLYDLARGVDQSRVNASRERKSISVENTFNQDIDTWADIEKQIEALFEELQIRTRKADIPDESIKSINVKFKFSDFTTMTRERSARPFGLSDFKKLARDNFNGQSLRLLGIGYKLATKTKKPRPRNQLTLFR